MLIRLYGYGLKRIVRQKATMFWSLLFPILLGTLFWLTFGSNMDDAVSFQQIPVAYVEKANAQEEFPELLKELETGEDLIRTEHVSEEKAKQMLKEGTVAGIYFNDSQVTMMVDGEGMAQSILKSVLEQYQRVSLAFSNISSRHPEGMAQAVQSVKEDWNYLAEQKVSGNEMNFMMDFFYALIAMSCLYGCFMGVNCAVEYKADLSALAARRVTASTDRRVILLAEIGARITVQFICTLAGVCYLKYVLGIQLGNQMGHILLVILAGSCTGILTGVFIGSLGKMHEQTKIGISVMVTMLCCFLAGLMVDGMYRAVEETAPIVNRINPAALIVKAFYSLNIYGDYTRYTQSLLSLLGIGVLLGLGSYILIRRERYASI